MQERLRQRLMVLRGEFAAGQARLQELEAQQGRLRETLLRIAGAIQVLEELLGEGSSTTAVAAALDGTATAQRSGTEQ